MSVFVNVARYDEEGPDGGNLLPITEAELRACVKKLPGYKVIAKEDVIGVTLGGVDMAAALDDGILSCRYDFAEDGDALIKALRKLAKKLPGAVVEDEEGNVL